MSGRRVPSDLDEEAGSLTLDWPRRLGHIGRCLADGTAHATFYSGTVVEVRVYALKGLTGPIGKALHRLAGNGKLPSGLPKPVETLRDPTVRSWERTGTFVMPRALVPVFQAAAKRVEP